MGMFNPPPPPPAEPQPQGYGPSPSGAWSDARPGAVTAVVVISYLQAALALLVALGLLILGLTAGSGRGQGLVLVVVDAILFAVIGVLLAVMGNRLGKRSRGWRTAYLVLTGIGVVLGVVDVGQNPSSLGGTIIGIVCIVLLLLPRSRAWFTSAP